MPQADISKRRLLLRGMRDGVPIGLGYFAVGFGLGISARDANLTAFEGFIASLLNNASAGEYAGFALIAANAAYWEIALVTLITNARYLLMSAALSQKLSPKMPFFHRLLIGFDVTDELFGIGISYPGYLEPVYMYGAFLLALPGWSVGTALGIAAGNLFPARVVSALSVAIYGMFLAVIIPPARKNRVVFALVLISFAASWAAASLPLLDAVSSGTKTILLTVVISGTAAALFPIADTEPDAQTEN